MVSARADIDEILSSNCALSFCRSFVGYSNANYALSEVRDPVRTLKRAAPLAMLAVTAGYLLVNVAYFAVVSKTDILQSRRIVA
jgi:amino acid transporter